MKHRTSLRRPQPLVVNITEKRGHARDQWIMEFHTVRHWWEWVKEVCGGTTTQAGNQENYETKAEALSLIQDHIVWESKIPGSLFAQPFLPTLWNDTDLEQTTIKVVWNLEPWGCFSILAYPTCNMVIQFHWKATVQPTCHPVGFLCAFAIKNCAPSRTLGPLALSVIISFSWEEEEKTFHYQSARACADGASKGSLCTWSLWANGLRKDTHFRAGFSVHVQFWCLGAGTYADTFVQKDTSFTERSRPDPYAQ